MGWYNHWYSKTIKNGKYTINKKDLMGCAGDNGKLYFFGEVSPRIPIGKCHK